MFIFKFKTKDKIPAYSAGGRIQLEFPTVDIENN